MDHQVAGMFWTHYSIFSSILLFHQLYLCTVYMHNYVDCVGQSMNPSALYTPPAWLSVPNYIA